MLYERCPECPQHLGKVCPRCGGTRYVPTGLNGPKVQTLALDYCRVLVALDTVLNNLTFNNLMTARLLLSEKAIDLELGRQILAGLTGPPQTVEYYPGGPPG